jgi:hypothetical protein
LSSEPIGRPVSHPLEKTEHAAPHRLLRRGVVAGQRRVGKQVTESRLSRAQSRSISPENFTGAKGKGGMATDGPAASAARGLGQGWKVSPYIISEPGDTFTLADLEGSGAFQQIWTTLARGTWRHSILRA